MRGIAVETRALQGAVAVLALVPLAAGLAGALDGAALTDAARTDAALDSHVRYLSGLLLAIGLGFWSTVPDIAAKAPRFRLLTALVVTGGICRLLGVALHGWPPPAMRFGLFMELVATPALCAWQARIAARVCRAA